MIPGQVVTFYSYKGGVGRTFALANVGALLALWGYRVVCLDWDLEAPGLDLYYKRWIEKGRPGVVELVCAYGRRESVDWKEHVTEVKLPEATIPLHLIKAGIQDSSYLERMQSLNWSRLYEEQGLGTFIEGLREQWKAEYDFVLIDSRTGITDVGGICTVQLPDQLVLLLTANEQSLTGSTDFVKRLASSRNRLPFDRAKLTVLPVVARFEMRVEYEKAQQWLGRFAQALAPIYQEWAHKEVPVPDLLNHTRIPYIPYWSFGEELPVIDKGTSDPEDIGFFFETIAALVAHRLSQTDALVKNRDTFVATAKHGSEIVGSVSAATSQTSPPPPPQVFISYSRKDERTFRELLRHLSPLSRSGVITSWHERTIEPGSDWRAEIDSHLEKAKIIIFLVSADFLASDYASGIEMKRAIEKHRAGEATLIPVIVRPCDWSASALAEFQALPRDARPISLWRNRDEALLNVTQGVTEAIVRRPETPEQAVAGKLGAASSYHQLGMIAQEQRDFVAAESWYRKALSAEEELGDRYGAAITYQQLGRVAQAQRDFSAAEQWYRKSLAIEEKQGDEQGAAVIYHQLGIIAQEQGDLAAAEQWYRRSLAIEEKQGDEQSTAATYHQLGTIAQERGNFAAAERCYLRSLAIEEGRGNEHGAAVTYGRLGVVAAMRGDFLQSGRWLIKGILKFLILRDADLVNQCMTIFMRACHAAPPADQIKLEAMWKDAGLGEFPPHNAAPKSSPL